MSNAKAEFRDKLLTEHSLLRLMVIIEVYCETHNLRKDEVDLHKVVHDLYWAARKDQREQE